ncbi:hypothetical protein [Methylotenera sp.]|uniref:helix-turn-helix transcriptional regulator n=1 Tax=Methylotenera sp. TaxID=2051956 RepID=UPI002489F919|nr:hypothetical protein [Methylotenera sp.]MDI1298070.1 hypothetical protein [Methylotenera sp.]
MKINTVLRKKTLNTNHLNINYENQIDSSIYLKPTAENLMATWSPAQIALMHFDQFPDSAFVRVPVVLCLLACSKATLWRWVKESRVPAPCKMGARISAWNVGQLRKHLNQIKDSEKIHKGAAPHLVSTSKEGGK